MYDKFVISLEKTVKDAIDIIDRENAECIFIVDSANILQGIFTQGDMRRYILKSGKLKAPITEAMNKKPVTFLTRKEAEKASKIGKMVVYPVVNKDGYLVDILFRQKDVISENASKALSDIPLVIMAGGMGTRLYPYTKILPKALIPIGNLTIAERIINNFVSWGCKEVYLILNHKANMIKSYFEELDKPYTIHYILEDNFLGTGGGLSLLKGMINTTFILSNCDILVNTDFECVIKTHELQRNIITFIGAMKGITIPYGVITTTEDGHIKALEEKPEISFLSNTGVYIIDPKVINELKDNEFVHITTIAEKYMKLHQNIGVFPIPEKMWLDMGQFNEMETMLKELGING